MTTVLIHIHVQVISKNQQSSKFLIFKEQKTVFQSQSTFFLICMVKFKFSFCSPPFFNYYLVTEIQKFSVLIKIGFLVPIHDICMIEHEQTKTCTEVIRETDLFFIKKKKQLINLKPKEKFIDFHQLLFDSYQLFKQNGHLNK